MFLKGDFHGPTTYVDLGIFVQYPKESVQCFSHTGGRHHCVLIHQHPHRIFGCRSSGQLANPMHNIIGPLDAIVFEEPVMRRRAEVTLRFRGRVGAMTAVYVVEGNIGIQRLVNAG